MVHLYSLGSKQMAPWVAHAAKLRKKKKQQELENNRQEIRRLKAELHANHIKTEEQAKK